METVLFECVFPRFCKFSSVSVSRSDADWSCILTWSSLKCSCRVSLLCSKVVLQWHPVVRDNYNTWFWAIEKKGNVIAGLPANSLALFLIKKLTYLKWFCWFVCWAKNKLHTNNACSVALMRRNLKLVLYDFTWVCPVIQNVIQIAFN